MWFCGLLLRQTGFNNRRRVWGSRLPEQPVLVIGARCCCSSKAGCFVCSSNCFKCCKSPLVSAAHHIHYRPFSKWYNQWWGEQWCLNQPRHCQNDHGMLVRLALLQLCCPKCRDVITGRIVRYVMWANAKVATRHSTFVGVFIYAYILSVEMYW